MEISINFIEGLLSLSITGLVGWLWFVHNKLQDVQIELAKNYHNKEELRKVVDDAMFPVWRELERIARALEKLSDDNSK